ncbi:hypothetical protein N5T78_08260 [Aliarcobacter cryaerophilus]|jgi:hypothetical protein|uniref:hypothetical protein n=1 Tax=Aliarcobacter cryaerophilus TaxID=28198 RepID=UPI0021B65995|nr:hypothetical protein [Aliarcobacter cryaerophilus]MCT7466568.1 hypothetical protein [Aliarcobacter cryaerophilus]MCT7542352.1 hypothetical protein [Aliarcobacter cryaerophilus]
MSVEKDDEVKPKVIRKRVTKEKVGFLPNESQIQYSLFDTKQKINESTATLMDLRVSPFMPVDKISHNSALAKEFVANKNILKRETAFGTVEIRNRLLTQYHKMILDCIMIHNTRSVVYKGTIAIYFSIYEIAQKLGLEWSGKTQKNIQEAIEYIKDVVIVRTDSSGSGIASSYNIIQEMKYSSKEQSYVIVLSSLYAEYFNKTMSINYNKRFDELISIRGKGSAFIRSIIEFFITHDASAENIQRMKLIQLLETINYPCETPRQISSAKQYLKDYEDELAKFNIKYYSGSQLFEYSGTTDIRFIPPLDGLLD